MPVANERRWAVVREYLIETRKLPTALVDRLHERGLIYADAIQNAVFVRHATHNTGARWYRGELAGASLRGTWGENNSFHGLASGSAREQGWFWIGTGKGEVKRVLLTESPIDTLSLATLDRKRRQAVEGVTVYLSTDGAGTIPIQALKQVLERGGQVVVAFDADRAGELMAWQVAQDLPGIKRVTPAYGKDWNDRLIYDGHPEQAPQLERDKQTLNTLWKWHQIAQSLDKSQQYLQRITEVSRAVVQGESLSNQARVAIQQDFQEFSQQQRQAKLDWQVAPLLRVVLLQSKAESELMIICHHAIADGISGVYLMRDILQGLGGKTFERTNLSAALSLESALLGISTVSRSDR